EALGVWFESLGIKVSVYNTILEVLAVLLGYFVIILDIHYHAGYTIDNYATRTIFSYLYHFVFTTALMWCIYKYRSNFSIINYWLVSVNSIVFLFVIG